jgi:transposase
MDESRFGLKGVKRRRLTLRGVKPVGSMHWRFEYFYVYGAVEPATGESHYWIFTHLDGVCFAAYLQKLSQAYPEDLIVLQVDNGGFHKWASLEIPENIFLVFQPPYSPELNPIERVWQYIKDKLAWQVFEDLQALEDKVSEELVKAGPEVIGSLASYGFIMDALFRSIL